MRRRLIKRNEPLLRVDPVVEAFAQKIGRKVIYNYHGGPNRYIQFQLPNRLIKLIMMSSLLPNGSAVSDAPRVRVVVDIVAYEDSETGRSTWSQTIADLGADEVQPQVIQALLERAFDRLSTIDAGHLRRHSL